jgi:hypothetical protein
MSDNGDQSARSARPKIFISYCRRDAEAADSLAKLCSKLGAETWLGRSEIRPGVSWREQLSKAISRSNILLILLSSHGKADIAWQSRDWSEICEHKWAHPDVRIIPILLDRSEIPKFLSGFVALDGSSNTKLARCVEHIKEYPEVREFPEQRSLSAEQRTEVESRFRELLAAIADISQGPTIARLSEK